MKLNIPWGLISKKLQNELSPDDERKLEFWRNSTALNETIFREIMDDERIQDALKSGKWNDISGDWQAILNRIEPSVKKFTIARYKFRIAMAAAAAILILCSVAIAFFFTRYSELKKQQAGSFTYIFSPRGQRTRVVLPDSTKVWLNSESSLRYASNYNAEKREVTMVGEAFFQVHHDPARPFLVFTEAIKIKVYGTSFNIKAFPEENRIETTLIEGKLSITPVKKGKGQDQEIFLKPNEKCIYLRENAGAAIKKEDITAKGAVQENKPEYVADLSKVQIKTNINTEEEMQWKEGKLIFRNETFDQLALKMERWYDIKIHFVDGKIRDYKFTGEFDKETINQAMEALKLSSQKSYQYEIVYRDIYLKSK